MWQEQEENRREKSPEAQEVGISLEEGAGAQSRAAATQHEISLDCVLSQVVKPEPVVDACEGTRT